jgi:hypothetical protein
LIGKANFANPLPMHRARIAVLATVALALSACPRVMPDEGLDGADVADELGSDSESSSVATDSTDTTETGGDANFCCTCPDIATSEFECWPWSGTVESCEVALASTLDEPTHWCEPDAEGSYSDCLAACEAPPEEGYCCTCAGCWLSSDKSDCVEPGEWHDYDSCEFVPPASGNCDLDCPPQPDFVGCCYCNEIGGEVCVTGTAEQCGFEAVEYFNCGEVDGVLSCGIACEPADFACCPCCPGDPGAACQPWDSNASSCIGDQSIALGCPTSFVPTDDCVLLPGGQYDCGSC